MREGFEAFPLAESASVGGHLTLLLSDDLVRQRAEERKAAEAGGTTFFQGLV